MSHARCAPACALFDLPDVHVLTIEHGPSMMTLTIETAPGPVGCPGCGVVAAAHGRRDHRLHDVPAFGTPVRLVWRKRLWRCREPACAVVTFSEVHELAAPGTRLTRRAAVWVTDALAHHDTSVSALAHQLGVSWRTAWRAIQLEATVRTSTAERLAGVDALGVDEHVWRHVGPPGTGMITGIVDHTRDEHGRVRARLLDLVPGRSGAAYADWLAERGAAFTGGIRTATLDPFHGYANAIRDELPEAITVLDAFHAGLARRADGGRGPSPRAASTPWATAGGPATRCTASAARCRSALSTSRPGRSPG